jgi:RHS repeat-associated protein
LVRSGSTLSTFVYDGDGNRVKATQNGVTTLYIGNHAEWRPASSTLVKYYYADAQRIAMAEGSTASYLLGDHLGSTSLTLNSSGTRVAELRYKPWGEIRYTSGTTPTQRRFTGQTQDTITGLYHYGARYYDPVAGRFVQADTLVPEPANPMAFDRYAYMLTTTL